MAERALTSLRLLHGVNLDMLGRRDPAHYGSLSLSELERRVDSGEMACAFSMHATSMGDLMAVADANEVMPPKSTWFEPKLADGLVSLQLD